MTELSTGATPATPATAVQLVALGAVNVGLPAPIGTFRGETVISGIAKRAVTVESLWLDLTNLEGDGQADLEAHGGPDKAVYAYPFEHLAVWEGELGEAVPPPAAFGENLSTLRVSEATVCIGDRWAWGDSVLEVCQPRWPCLKLTIHRGRADIGPRMRANGRTGWYLRVLQPGRVPVAGPITVVERDPDGLSVLDAHQAASPSIATPEERVLDLIVHDRLADEWKQRLLDRLRAMSWR